MAVRDVITGFKELFQKAFPKVGDRHELLDQRKDGESGAYFLDPL
jgi:hypothetical protein